MLEHLISLVDRKTPVTGTFIWASSNLDPQSATKLTGADNANTDTLTTKCPSGRELQLPPPMGAANHRPDTFRLHQPWTLMTTAVNAVGVHLR